MINSLFSYYNLNVFHHYINEIDGDCVCLLEVLLDTSIENFDEETFKCPFVIETDKQSYVFSDYLVNEYYDENGMTRVVLTK